MDAADFERLCFAAIEEAGITDPTQICPDYSHYTIEMLGMDLWLLEGRVALLEQMVRDQNGR